MQVESTLPLYEPPTPHEPDSADPTPAHSSPPPAISLTSYAFPHALHPEEEAIDRTSSPYSTQSETQHHPTGEPTRNFRYDLPHEREAREGAGGGEADFQAPPLDEEGGTRPAPLAWSAAQPPTPSDPAFPQYSALGRQVVGGGPVHRVLAGFQFTEYLSESTQEQPLYHSQSQSQSQQQYHPNQSYSQPGSSYLPPPYLHHPPPIRPQYHHPDEMRHSSLPNISGHSHSHHHPKSSPSPPSDLQWAPAPQPCACCPPPPPSSSSAGPRPPSNHGLVVPGIRYGSTDQRHLPSQPSFYPPYFPPSSSFAPHLMRSNSNYSSTSSYSDSEANYSYASSQHSTGTGSDYENGFLPPSSGICIPAYVNPAHNISTLSVPDGASTFSGGVGGGGGVDAFLPPKSASTSDLHDMDRLHLDHQYQQQLHTQHFYQYGHPGDGFEMDDGGDGPMGYGRGYSHSREQTIRGSAGAEGPSTPKTKSTKSGGGGGRGSSSRNIFHPSPQSMLAPNATPPTNPRRGGGKSTVPFPGTDKPGIPSDAEFAKMPTKRSRGRRPPCEPDLLLSENPNDHPSEAQIRYVGVTKTGRPKKIFLCKGEEGFSSFLGGSPLVGICSVFWVGD